MKAPQPRYRVRIYNGDTPIAFLARDDGMAKLEAHALTVPALRIDALLVELTQVNPPLRFEKMPA